ncbi:hypothetical protein [Paracoccus aestuariivivens]|uniref:Asparagine synthetase domain-containing protein n=1 Tax=Paracoccus aestuariivivens TaxID=1820333 RepID=A0A6L6JFE5_9RHOB|nr:hypothetical protein [Paracoccus aestuariivivens]MTH80296.1 hypothetical protein [Paracoccus aestuariivivens]
MDFFLFDQSNIPQDFLFQGYCFIDTDYIAGESGALGYMAETGKKILSGHDGCYFWGNPLGDGYQFGSDFQGNSRIYLYQREERWAISNSFGKLLDHIRKNEWPFSICSHQLDSWRIRSPFGQQPSSFKTAINEISLVPSWCEVSVNGDGAKITHRKYQGQFESYASAVSHYVGIWSGRISTLSSDEDICVSVDVSGGVDSRVNLALILKMREKGIGGNIRFSSLKYGGVKGDFEVALRLAEKYRFPLNDRKSKSDYSLSTDEALQCTDDFLIGSYTSLRPFRTKPNPLSVKIGGGAGEIFRPFFADSFSDEFLDKLRGSFSSDKFFANWKADVVDAMETLRVRDPGKTDPLILHYREFRSRFHTGGAANMVTAAMPFQSRAAYEIAWTATGSQIKDGQIGYDLIGATFPQLLVDDYDHPGKKPTQRNLDNIFPEIDFDARPGRVYVDKNHDPAPNSESLSDFLKKYYEVFGEKIRDWPMVEKLSANDIIRSSLETGRLPRPPEGASLHRLKLAVKIEELCASRRSNSGELELSDL